jgi:hypothetical protein
MSNPSLKINMNYREEKNSLPSDFSKTNITLDLIFKTQLRLLTVLGKSYATCTQLKYLTCSLSKTESNKHSASHKCGCFHSVQWQARVPALFDEILWHTKEMKSLQ